MTTAEPVNTEMNLPTVLAEIAGPSGAGKSTLSSTINMIDPRVRAGLTIWRLPKSSLAASCVSSATDLFRLGLERRRFRKEELKQVIRLDAFYRLLNHHVSDDRDRYSALMLDEGVVFAIAKLRADINADHRTPKMRYGEEKVLDRWSSILDAIVWLDAPDGVLIDRVRTRAKQHRMKNKPDATVREFLKRYREAYESVISDLVSLGGIRVLRFATEQIESLAMANEIRRMCDEIRGTKKWVNTSPEVEVKSGHAVQPTIAGQ